MEQTDTPTLTRFGINTAIFVSHWTNIIRIQFHPRHQKGGAKQRFLFLELVELLAIYNSNVDFYLIFILLFCIEWI